MLREHAKQVQIVTYYGKEIDYACLEDVLKSASPEDLFIISFGPHITALAKRLSGRRIIYYAQSFGWRITLPNQIPIFCVSRYVLSQWAVKSPTRPLFLLPPVIDVEYQDSNVEREIDILVYLSPKMSPYLSSFVKKLQNKYRVLVIDKLIPRRDFLENMKKANVFLYYSKPILDSRGAEGFGLMPLEALCCGCKVFSNLFGGLSDYLDPGINAYQLGVYSMEYDLQRLSEVIKQKQDMKYRIVLREAYSENMFHQRMKGILEELHCCFKYRENSVFSSPKSLCHFGKMQDRRRFGFLTMARKLIGRALCIRT
ncbi:MAG: glycosyltransferase [Candidatus Omnitrophica bacterium]|nr:glycosyltransferase [Candidatus Omnitrophota bacterium]